MMICNSILGPSGCYQCRSPPHAANTNNDNAKASVKPSPTAMEWGKPSRMAYTPKWRGQKRTRFARRANLIESKDAPPNGGPGQVPIQQPKTGFAVEP